MCDERRKPSDHGAEDVRNVTEEELVDLEDVPRGDPIKADIDMGLPAGRKTVH